VDTVQMLLYLGADPTLINLQGKAPQDVVCQGGNRQHRDAILAALEVSRRRAHRTESPT
jgi:hypothetical protein